MNEVRGNVERANQDGGLVAAAQAGGRAFITAPVMITFPIAYSTASVLWNVAGQIKPAWDTTHIEVGILITLLVSVAVLIVDLLTTEDPLSWKSFGLRDVYFLFNFVVLLAAELHIDVIPLDQSGTGGEPVHEEPRHF